MPAGKKQKKDSQTTFRLSSAELENLKRVAAQEGRSIPDMIRRAIAQAYPIPKK
jgi:predicted DNA binding CopG/RHH family protein